MKSTTTNPSRSKAAAKAGASSAKIAIDRAKAEAHIETLWEKDIVPTITEYIRIPNKSPHFDAKWEETGHIQRAADLIEGWCKKRKLPMVQVMRALSAMLFFWRLLPALVRGFSFML